MTPGKSLHPAPSRLPASVMCHPSYSAITQLHIRAHAHMGRDNLTHSSCFSHALMYDFSVHTCITIQLSSYWRYYRLECNLVHSRVGYDFPAEYQWTLEGAFKINGSTLLLAGSRPTYSFFYPHHIMLLLFMNGSVSFVPHIPRPSLYICRWHRCKS